MVQHKSVEMRRMTDFLLLHFTIMIQKQLTWMNSISVASNVLTLNFTVMPPRKIWNFFTRGESNKTAICSVCNVLKNMGSTSILWTHYNRWHKPTANENNEEQHAKEHIGEIDSNESNSDNEQIALTSSTFISSQSTSSSSIGPALKRKKYYHNISKKNSRPLDKNQYEIITQSICKMIIVDMLPFSTVENKGFRSFISTIEPLYSIPLRKSITTRIEKMYIDKSKSIKNIIENINYISLTTNGWTSRAIDSYLTFTAHYFYDNWKLYSVTLSIEEIQESHTVENLKDSIMNVIESWNLNSKITGISHDNVANISNAVKLFYDQDIYSNRCAAHTLQLAVKKFLDLNTCRPLLKTESKIVAIEKECKKLNLVQSCPTRWNSTLDMLERLLDLRSAVVVIMSVRTLFNIAYLLYEKMTSCD
ncbi:hypothetical protein QTP88_010571 [Uroleucon formosanum]